MSTAYAHDVTDCSSLYPFPTTGSGTDFEGLSRFFLKTVREFMEPVTIGHQRDEAVNSLYDVYEECSNANWDGYEAHPVSLDAYLEARSIIDRLPLSFPMPDIVPEPNGALGLEWRKGKRQVFVASVNGHSKIEYAGLFRENKTSGVEYYCDVLPSVVIDNIRRLYRQ